MPILPDMKIFEFNKIGNIFEPPDLSTYFQIWRNFIIFSKLRKLSKFSKLIKLAKLPISDLQVYFKVSSVNRSRLECFKKVAIGKINLPSIPSSKATAGKHSVYYLGTIGIL